MAILTFYMALKVKIHLRWNFDSRILLAIPVCDAVGTLLVNGSTH